MPKFVIERAIPGVGADELQNVAARSGMRELTVRAFMHRASLGDISSGQAARLLIDEINNPVVGAMFGIAPEPKQSFGDPIQIKGSAASTAP